MAELFGNWKVGGHPSTIVSDTIVKNTNFPSPPNRAESSGEEMEYYGGYLVCESVGNDAHAKLIAAAPGLLNALQILTGEIDRGPKKLTIDEKLSIAKAAIKKATE